ncbi:MAG TPA: hypothetical protein VF338_08945, partial [Leptolinea sp.]
PADLATMHDLEQHLNHLMRDSSAEGLILTTLTGQVLYEQGPSSEYKIAPNLINACTNLVGSIKQIAHQPDESTTLGLLTLSGGSNDLVVSHISKYFIWLIYPSGSQPAEVGKATAAVYASRNSLFSILNLLAFLPTPAQPHPPLGKEELKKEGLKIEGLNKEGLKKEILKKKTAPLAVDEIKVTDDFTKKRIPKKDVDDFWDAENAKKSDAEISPDAISFDKASSLGLLPSDKS